MWILLVIFVSISLISTCLLLAILFMSARRNSQIERTLSDQQALNTAHKLRAHEPISETNGIAEEAEEAEDLTQQKELELA